MENVLTVIKTNSGTFTAKISKKDKKQISVSVFLNDSKQPYAGTLFSCGTNPTELKTWAEAQAKFYESTLLFNMETKAVKSNQLF